MPSPPTPVSSVHQATPAATDASSVVSTARRPVARTSSGATADEPVGDAEVPDMVVVGPGPALGREHLEGSDLHAVETVGRPHVASVRGGVVVGVLGAGTSAGQEVGDVDATVGGLGQSADRMRAVRIVPRLRQRRTGGAAGPPPSPTKAAVRSPAEANPCPVRPTARRRRSRRGAVRAVTRSGPAGRTTVRSGCAPRRSCRRSPRTGCARPRRHGRRAPPPATPCASPRTGPARRRTRGSSRRPSSGARAGRRSSRSRTATSSAAGTATSAAPVRIDSSPPALRRRSPPGPSPARRGGSPHRACRGRR